MRHIGVVLVAAYVAFVIVAATTAPPPKPVVSSPQSYCWCAPGVQWDCVWGAHWPCRDVLDERSA